MENTTKSNDNKLNKEIIRLLINTKRKSAQSFINEDNTESNYINTLKKNYNYDNETINKLFINNDKYYLREKKKTKNIPELNIKRKREKSLKKKKSIKNTINPTFHKKFDLNSKVIKKEYLLRLLSSLNKKIDSKRDKTIEEKKIYLSNEERTKFIKEIRFKIINLTLAQIKEISNTFFNEFNNNEDEINLELNKLNHNELKRLNLFVNDLKNKNSLNENFISYKDELKKHEINNQDKKEKNELKNFQSIFGDIIMSDSDSDSDSDESDSLNEKSTNN